MNQCMICDVRGATETRGCRCGAWYDTIKVCVECIPNAVKYFTIHDKVCIECGSVDCCHAMQYGCKRCMRHICERCDVHTGYTDWRYVWSKHYNLCSNCMPRGPVDF